LLDVPMEHESNGTVHYAIVQSLASPAYLHYLATITTSEGQSLLLCPRFKAFLKYLQATWSRPEYVRFVTYPHSLHFLDLLIKNDAFCRELAQVSFRNFAHQQQYFAWQNRFTTLFGGGEQSVEPAITPVDDENSVTKAEAPSS
jgi:mediator of RNA polymerase II transcription subunit 31